MRNRVIEHKVETRRRKKKKKEEKGKKLLKTARSTSIRIQKLDHKFPMEREEGMQLRGKLYHRPNDWSIFKRHGNTTYSVFRLSTRSQKLERSLTDRFLSTIQSHHISMTRSRFSSFVFSQGGTSKDRVISWQGMRERERERGKISNNPLD